LVLLLIALPPPQNLNGIAPSPERITRHKCATFKPNHR